MHTSKSGGGAVDAHALDWNLLKCFCAVAEAGAVSRAAALLGVSQPTVSRQIAELESAVGAALFERVARGVALTSAGVALREPARRMLEAAQAASVAAAAQGTELAGTVRITASETMAAFVLPPMLARLRAAHPRIQIELVASNRLDNLLTREADIAVRMMRPAQSGVVTRRIAAYPVGFYAHRDYLKTRRLPADGADPRRYDWVGLDQSNMMIEGFRAAGYMVDKSFFAFRCDNHIVGWQAVLAGMGVGVTLQCVGERYRELVRVLPDQKLPPLEVWLAAHRELRDVPRIRTVFDLLAAELARGELKAPAGAPG
ncbi:MAG TPA: LysR family transcriptional regulator [Noviherbaspirillum sp.]|nr:LysR family transcriptional regulator [Noviherbaspirillum sp.]